MQGREFLPVAEHLRQQEGQPYLRTSVGRSYYAAYLEARAFCELRLGYVRSRTSREHQDGAILLRSLDSDVMDKLTFLRTFRNAADDDIHLSRSTLVITADDALAVADRIIARFDAVAPDTPSS